MGDLAAAAGVIVALLAAGVAIFAADFSRRQAKASERQATTAEEQAEIAQEQAEAAREQAQAARDQVEAAMAQVAEARRANDLLEAELTERRARDAVKWTAKMQHDGKTVHVRNVGNETAHDVQIQIGGADEDWERRHPADIDAEEVRPGDMAVFRLRGGYPTQLYVNWDKAKHPTAVEIIQYR